MAAYPPAERIGRLDEACSIIKRMWREPVVDHDGRYYHYSEIYCNPKSVHQPTPPFVLGGGGEQLTLRVVARHADVWNYAGLPALLGSTAAEFRHKSAVLDRHCATIGRDPASIVRSAQIIFDTNDGAGLRSYVAEFIAAGATHFVLGPRGVQPGSIGWLSEEVIKPLLEAHA